VVRDFWGGRSAGGALSTITLGPEDRKQQPVQQPLVQPITVFYNPLLRLFVHSVVKLLFVWSASTTEHESIRTALHSVLGEILEVEYLSTMHFYSDVLLVTRRGAVPVMRSDNKQALSKQAKVLRGYAAQAQQRWKENKLDRAQLDDVLSQVDSLEQYIQFYVAGDQQPRHYTRLEYLPLGEMQLSLYRQQLFGERGLYSTARRQRALLKAELEQMAQDRQNRVALQLYYDPLLSSCAGCNKAGPVHVDTQLGLAFCDDKCYQAHCTKNNLQQDALLQCDVTK
jgi:hypothetical protein